MYSLIIDSATKKLYVCLLKNNDILFENLSLGANVHGFLKVKDAIIREGLV